MKTDIQSFGKRYGKLKKKNPVYYIRSFKLTLIVSTSLRVTEVSPLKKKQAKSFETNIVSKVPKMK